MPRQESFSDRLDDELDRYDRKFRLLCMLIVDAARRGDDAAVHGGLDVVQGELDKLIAGSN